MKGIKTSNLKELNKLKVDPRACGLASGNSGEIPLAPTSPQVSVKLDKFSSLFFYLSILIFIIGFGFTDSPTPSGWYQQFMPNLSGRNVTDFFFLDSLTGWSVTNATNQQYDTTYVLKTTNGGDNWNIQYRKNQNGGGYSGYFRVYFLNQTTGYTCGVTGFDKSTDGGLNWTPIWTADTYVDMSILNVDTQWVVSSNSLTGGVFFTSNGGQNWTVQYSQSSANPSHIYMFNRNIGFMDGGGLKKTTNGGFNWDTIPGEGLFFDMYFIDSLVGWKCNQLMKKTTDGGLNWINQTLPSGGNILFNYMLKFSSINKDTLWGVGGTIFYSSGQYRGMIFKSIDNGQNWLFQVPDTSIHIGEYFHTKFVNKLNGWAYAPVTGVHTVTGGDSTFFTWIKKMSDNVPIQFKLYQNFPNPFNPGTVIKYQITTKVKSQKSNVKLIVYDINGKEIITLVNQQQRAGSYQVDFSGNGYSSGVYFYSLIIDGKLIDTKRMILLK